MKHAVQRKECPICFDPLAATPQGQALAENALSCCNGHQICVPCASKLVHPKGARCSPQCAGLAYACPLCRASACITHTHMLVLIKGSWQKAIDCFPSADAMRAWNRREAFDEEEEEIHDAAQDYDDVPPGTPCVDAHGNTVVVGDTLRVMETGQTLVVWSLCIGLSDRCIYALADEGGDYGIGEGEKLTDCEKVVRHT
jgi:hypothetical protein